MTAPVGYIRTRGGTVVHKDWCRYATQGITWSWAAGRTPAEIVADGRRRNLRWAWCHHCCPKIEEAR